MLLIGSQALNYHFPGTRKAKDYDFIATSKEVDHFLSIFSWKDTSSHSKKRRAKVLINDKNYHFEFELREHYPSSIFLENKDSNKVGFYDKFLRTSYHIASPEALFLIKKSHITFNIHWWKNIQDFLFLKSKINFLPSWHQEFYDLRYSEIYNRVKRKQINFDLNNSEFFQKSEKFVNRIVEHDSLHYATCFYEKPLFFLAKNNPKRAILSPEKFGKWEIN